MNIYSSFKYFVLIFIALLLHACSSTPPPLAPSQSTYKLPTLAPSPFLPGHIIQLPAQNAQYTRTLFNTLPHWQEQRFSGSLKAFQKSCQKLANTPQWQTICGIAQQTPLNQQAAKQFFENNFTPWQISQNGTFSGTVTGYYEPGLSGSLTPSAQARFPIYGIPRDFISVPLPEQYRHYKTLRIQPQGMNAGVISNNGMYTAQLNQFHITAHTKALKGRFVGRSFVPYFNRAQINAGAIAQTAPILAYANDPVELFFLQVQGSGRLQTPSGSSIRLAFAEKNDHPYQSIGRYMANRGYLPLKQADMQGIKNWLQQNPHKLSEVLGHNPSFVFFRRLPESHDDGPIGALGVPLSGEFSAAIDKHFIPLGAPIFVATTDPRNNRALDRLMIAQDTGSAITGAVRVDFFWGYGEQAGAIAGKMKYPGYTWLLLPNNIAPQFKP